MENYFSCLPPLLTYDENGKPVWQAHTEVNYPSLGYLLSCHLIIEHYLEVFIKTRIKLDFDIRSMRLSFAIKLAMLEKADFEFLPALKHLNKLRNTLSHNIGMTIDSEALRPLEHYLISQNKEIQEFFDDTPEPVEVLGLFTYHVCAYVAGRLETFHKQEVSSTQITSQNWFSAIKLKTE